LVRGWRLANLEVIHDRLHAIDGRGQSSCAVAFCGVVYRPIQRDHAADGLHIQLFALQAGILIELVLDVARHLRIWPYFGLIAGYSDRE
jgi:hypothetical protein